MGRHYLLYWTPESADQALAAGGPLDHAASDQLHKVEAGDTIWIGTVRDEVLYLLGSLDVECITDQVGATNMLGRTDLWEAKYHAIAKRDSARPMRSCRVPLSVATGIRFVSDARPALVMVEGKVDARQLQAMRELTPYGARLLASVCEESEGAGAV